MPHGIPRCDVARFAGPATPTTSVILSLSKDRAVLLQVGFTRARVTAERRALLPHDFTLTAGLCQAEPVEAGGGMFLWHFPSSCPDRTLSCTLPDGARTFLGACAPRRPGVLRDVYRTRSGRSPQAFHAPSAEPELRWNRSTSRNSRRARRAQRCSARCFCRARSTSCARNCPVARWART